MPQGVIIGVTTGMAADIGWATISAIEVLGHRTDMEPAKIRKRLIKDPTSSGFSLVFLRGSMGHAGSLSVGL